jgi:hypothetical protein
MAEKKPAKAGGSGVSKKLGPLPYWGWGAVGIGTYVIYRYLKARSAAESALTASGTTGGTTIPAGALQTASSTASGQGTFGSTSAWVQAALDYLTSNGVDGGDAFNGITAYLNGNCVSQTVYNGLSSAFSNTSIGLPPSAFNSATLPPLTVCPAAQQTPTPSNPAPAAPSPVATVVSQLADIQASAWPTIVKFGQDPNAATDFTQIGVVNNGVYSGYNVTHGAPVYAGAFGGYAQDFDEATLPNGTAIYAPTTLINQGYLGSHT